MLSGLAGLALVLLALQLGPLRLGAGDSSVFGFPVHHDDFRNLSYVAFGDLPPLTVRPVSMLALGLLSVAGPKVYYGSLYVLVALYVALVLTFVARLFPATGWPRLLTTGAAALGALSFERVPEYVLYSGLVTNLVSAVTAAAALLALEIHPESRRGRIVALAAGVVLFAASVFAKEDFALAVIAWVVWRAAERRVNSSKDHWRRDLALVLILLAICLLFLAWSLSGTRPTFLRASGETYRSVFSLPSLLATAARYLWCTPGARLATLVQAAALLLLWWLGDRRAARRAVGLAVVTLALIAPYAALPNHFFPYYAFNWVVWQSASLLALAPLLTSLPRLRKGAFGLAVALLSVGWVVSTQAARVSLIKWYAGEAGRNRAIVHTLEVQRQAILRWPIVGVRGVMPLNPWFGNDGAYLRRRLGFPNRWVVFASDDYLERTETLLRSLRMGSIEVRDVAEMHGSGLPILELTPDGRGALVLPSSETSLESGIRFVARPPRLRVCDGSGLGVTRLEWTAPVPMEVRVGSPDGALFAGPAIQASAETGKWVNDGAPFFLREPGGRVARVLTVRVSAEGCR